MADIAAATGEDSTAAAIAAAVVAGATAVAMAVITVNSNLRSFMDWR
jgi:hypothetical protein